MRRGWVWNGKRAADLDEPAGGGSPVEPIPVFEKGSERQRLVVGWMAEPSANLLRKIGGVGGERKADSIDSVLDIVADSACVVSQSG